MTEQISSSSCKSGASSNIQKILMESSLSKINHKIMVMSGKGGVGKSSISAYLAVSLSRRGFKTGLMDVDLHGPSIAGIMGINGLLDITEDRFILPKPYDENLTVVSMQSLMNDSDQAVIFRGPAKTGMIRRFIGDVQWGNLDFLIIDAPPGTGDEPLSVAQSISDAKALIITTPQDVALSDVRKSINFCRAVNMDMLGLVENMGPFPCPCCGKIVEIFKSGGGLRTAKQMNIDFLGTLPFDPEVVKACDKGKPESCNSEAFQTAFDKLTETIMQKFDL